MPESNEVAPHRKRKVTCFKCGTEGLWWNTNGKTAALSTTKNFYTPHNCSDGGDNVYDAKHPYETKPKEQMMAEARAMLRKLFGRDE